jgi:hypothetical protein
MPDLLEHSIFGRQLAEHIRSPELDGAPDQSGIRFDDLHCCNLGNGLANVAASAYNLGKRLQDRRNAGQPLPALFIGNGDSFLKPLAGTQVCAAHQRRKHVDRRVCQRCFQFTKRCHQHSQSPCNTRLLKHLCGLASAFAGH